MADSCQFRRLNAPFGAEVVGFDSRQDAALGEDDASRAGSLADVARAIREALDVHQLLLLRGAEWRPEQQVALLSALGPPLVENDRARPYQFVSNTHAEGILGAGRFTFHSDHAFMPDPIEVISLYAIELPEGGSQTRFVNALAAARTLPVPLGHRIEGRSARHIIDPEADSDAVASAGRALPDDLPHAHHPILMPHPRTGESILYVSEQQTDRVEDLPAAESKDLLEALFAHIYSEAFTYTHDWEPGDLLIWDNRALQHARDVIAPGASRTLRRVSVGGTSVYAYFEESGRFGPA